VNSSAHRSSPQRRDDDGPLENEFAALLVAEGNGPAAVLVEAFDGVDEVPIERIAAHLAIAHDVHPRLKLKVDRVVHGAVLDLLELRGV
jgi:hypothetical protein